jgi:hypothetical protein
MALNDPITAPERFTAIVRDEAGNQVMTLRMSEFVEAIALQVNQNIPTSGTGSPEGVVTAEPFKTYLDTAAAAGSNYYVKKTGSGSTGWQLV